MPLLLRRRDDRRFFIVFFPLLRAFVGGSTSAGTIGPGAGCRRILREMTPEKNSSSSKMSFSLACVEDVEPVDVFDSVRIVAAVDTSGDEVSDRPDEEEEDREEEEPDRSSELSPLKIGRAHV